MRYVLAHDLGTSGNKATLFDEQGHLAASVTQGYPVHFFNATWAEQEAEDWWQAVCASTRCLLAQAKVDPGQVAAVCFSGQMMGCLCVDRNGVPLRPSIIWADQRAQQEAAHLAQKIAPLEHFMRTGHRNTASYGLPKLMWLRQHEPQVYAQTYRVLNAKDYMVYKLTGRFVTEPTDAAGFNAVDLDTLSWSQDIVDASGVDGDKLPPIVPSASVAGQVTVQAAQQTGLAAGTPVVPGGGDGVCATVGAGSVAPGATYCYVGSSSWAATTTARPLHDPQMRVVTWAHIVPGLYSPNGAMQCGGGSYGWMKNVLCATDARLAREQGQDPYEALNAEAAQSPAGANGVLFLPHLLGERSPRWNANARGAFIGLKMENTRADLLRSVMEGVAMNLALNLDVFAQHVPVEDVLLIGGGAKSPLWAQIMADIFAKPLHVPALLEEATSMGAALTGGVAAGVYPGFDFIHRMIQIRHTYQPDNGPLYARVRADFDACYHALEPVFERLARPAQ